jgi:hypothetical protein
MAVGVRLMMQGMNVDDRVELLAGMKDVPAPVFQGVLGIAASVLTDDELAKTKARLGIS